MQKKSLLFPNIFANMSTVSNMKIRFFTILIITVFSLTYAKAASANHSWANYHWARTNNPFTLQMGNNLSPGWLPYLQTTSADWSASSVLDTLIVSGATNGRRCRPTSGRLEVCNSFYGNNGWLGLAQIWVNGDHIVQGVTKINDTYFSQTQYNTTAWKNLVMCQEVGHIFGLNHQDEVFNNPNLNTCMDYTNDPTSNQHPNQHDYDELEIIYSHVDAFTTLKSLVQKLPLGFSTSDKANNNNTENRDEWGKELRNNGHVAEFERDFGNGKKLVTSVILAQ
jgi:hypothetical protein